MGMNSITKKKGKLRSILTYPKKVKQYTSKAIMWKVKPTDRH